MALNELLSLNDRMCVSRWFVHFEEALHGQISGPLLTYAMILGVLDTYDVRSLVSYTRNHVNITS